MSASEILLISIMCYRFSYYTNSVVVVIPFCSSVHIFAIIKNIKVFVCCCNVDLDQHKALEDEFYNVTVAQITARHRRELSRLEALVAEQLGHPYPNYTLINTIENFNFFS